MNLSIHNSTLDPDPDRSTAMSLHPPDADHGTTTSERFEYFMIRVTRSDKDPDRVSGLVERLGSGEKRTFETGDQLLRMVGGWFESSLKL